MARILIADDDAVSRRMFAGILQEAGHDITSARDGEAALIQLRTRRFDLVVTDLAMPTVSGLRLIRELRDSGSSIPVVAVSGTNADQLDLAEDYGADASLTKPVDRVQLVQAVSRLLTGSITAFGSMW